MPKKLCFKCGIMKSLEEFYRHPETADGHLGKCKTCTCSDVKKNYRIHYADKRIYDKKRGQSAHRKKQRLYSTRKYRGKYPERAKAADAVNRALRNGKLKREPCLHCGCLITQAHHKDYSKPLDIQWLCSQCHIAEHGRLVN